MEQLNRISLRICQTLSPRIMIPSKIPVDIELPEKSIDPQLSQDIQIIIDCIPKYEVIGINSNVADTPLC